MNEGQCIASGCVESGYGKKRCPSYCDRHCGHANAHRK